ncbi:hypothetical protein M9H77_16515 [Catharanthus roseus]|uniref:Uncharacterized protein n=1 Tax=Catharanthus roseus TaxID=4058 RepID=A0ACC0B1Z6_CATRO|nr:hypothetical protein M9H77_16515 [Catharanthus roseus]
MASSISSNIYKIILKSSDDKTFEIDASVDKSSVSGEDEVELKSFVHELVNDDEPTLFSLLLAVDYLGINGLLSLACNFLWIRYDVTIRIIFTSCSSSSLNLPQKRRQRSEE